MPNTSLEDCMILIDDELDTTNNQFLCTKASNFLASTRFPESVAHNSHQNNPYNFCDDDDDRLSSILSLDDPTRNVNIRYLCQNDVEDIKMLCKDLFPVEYPDYWYNDVASDPSLWSMAAVFNEKIIGICIAEIKRLNNCNGEDRDILSKKFPANTPVCYMLSLGVDKAFRRRGVASLLLDQLLSYVQNTSTANPIRAVYLHVLISNKEAISFYEKRKFRRHAKNFGYYNIDGGLHDSYTYVLYLNGGQAALAFSDALLSCGYFMAKPLKTLWRILKSIVS